MASDELRTVIQVADGIEQVLRPVGNFITEKLVDKGLGDLGGPILDVPNKVGNLGPLVLRQLGFGPGDEVYDRAEELQQGLDVNPVPLPNQPTHFNEVVIETDPGPAPPAPGADQGDGEVLAPNFWDP